jgi:hypothetical protein
MKKLGTLLFLNYSSSTLLVIFHRLSKRLESLKEGELDTMSFPARMRLTVQADTPVLDAIYLCVPFILVIASSSSKRFL